MFQLSVRFQRWIAAVSAVVLLCLNGLPAAVEVEASDRLTIETTHSEKGGVIIARDGGTNVFPKGIDAKSRATLAQGFLKAPSMVMFEEPRAWSVRSIVDIWRQAPWVGTIELRV